MNPSPPPDPPLTCECGRLAVCTQRTPRRIIGRKPYGGLNVLRCAQCPPVGEVVRELSGVARNGAWAEFLSALHTASAMLRYEVIEAIGQLLPGEGPRGERAAALVAYLREQDAKDDASEARIVAAVAHVDPSADGDFLCNGGPRIAWRSVRDLFVRVPYGTLEPGDVFLRPDHRGSAILVDAVEPAPREPHRMLVRGRFLCPPKGTEEAVTTQYAKEETIVCVRGRAAS